MPGLAPAPTTRLSPLVCFGTLACLLAWPGTAAAAQGGRLKIPPPTPAPVPEPQEPPPKVAEQDSQTAVKVGLLWGVPSNPAEEVFVEFELAANPTDARRGDCLDRLRALGLDTRATALKALGSTYGPSIQLAAELLEWVGLTSGENPADVAALIDAASRTDLVEAVGTCLDTALRLNGGFLPARAVTLLSHPNRTVRVVAETRLQKAPSPAHQERLMQSLESGRDADVRLRAARLLALQGQAPEVRLVLRRALRDDSVDVAFTAANNLAGESRPEQTAYLVSELRQKVVGAEAGYLAYALLAQQAFSDGALIPDDVLPRLEALLEDRDLFASGAAAACLAEYAYRTSAPVPASWSKLVGYALVRAVSGVVFYPQFSRFSSLAEASLQRASGEEFPQRQDWIVWLEGAGKEGLVFLRARLDLAPEQLTGLRVSWLRQGIGPDGSPLPSSWRTLCGQTALLLPAERLLGAQALAELAATLEQSGMLQPVGGGNRFGQATEPVNLTIELTLGDQRKRLTYRGRAAEGEVGAVADQLDRRFNEHAWQVLAGGEGPEFVLRHLDAMEGPDLNARAAAMVALTRGRITALNSPLLREWCLSLTTLPAVVPLWDPALAAEFLAEIAPRTQDSALAELLLKTALLRADPELAPLLADAVANLDEPLRSQLLAQGLTRLGLDSARLLVKDPRLQVRIAAVSALSHFGPAAGEDLRKLLQAEEMSVVVAALRGLGELADSQDTLAIMAMSERISAHEVRKEAIWALGQIGDPRALPVLDAAARSDQPVLRVSALLAIANIPGQEAQQVIGALFPVYAGTSLESSYLRALMERGAASARQALQPFLVHGERVLARRAAMLGGLLGDPAAAPSLLQWLQEDPRNAELLEALANTLCVDFRSLPDPAGTYLAWWRDHSEEPAASWFVAAARGSGFAVPAGFPVGGAAQAHEAVSFLLLVLESGPPHLRASATYLLHGLTGVDAQVVLAGTPLHELQRRSQPWRDWLGG